MVSDLWTERHPLPRHVETIHNATGISKAIDWVPKRELRCIGSWQTYKGMALLKALARHIDRPVVFFGATEQEITDNAHEQIRLMPKSPYGKTQQIMSEARALLLPLNNDLFGNKLTSPLKLWDYLATPIPIIAPKLPTILEIQNLSKTRMHLHHPDDLNDLQRAVQEALVAEPRAPYYRTWLQRAAEIDAFIKQVVEKFLICFDITPLSRRHLFMKRSGAWLKKNMPTSISLVWVHAQMAVI